MIPDEMTIFMIKKVLNDDKNYQTQSLKLGAIWGLCDDAYDYERWTSTDGCGIVSVLSKKQKEAQ